MNHSCESESVHPRHVPAPREAVIRARLRARVTSPEAEGLWNEDQRDARHLAEVIDVERDQNEALWISYRDEQWAAVRLRAELRQLTRELAAHELAAQMADAQYRESLAICAAVVQADSDRHP